MKKALIIYASATALFSMLMIGIFIGRSTFDGAIRVYPEHIAPAEATSAISGIDTNDHGKININTASEEQLLYLKGIGPVIAQRIITYRRDYGDFMTIEEIMEVEGIGEKLFEQIKQYITVGG